MRMKRLSGFLCLLCLLTMAGGRAGAAASLSVNAAFCNPAGTTVYVSIAGSASSGGSPTVQTGGGATTGVTGFTVSVAGGNDVITSATTNGAEVVLVLTTAITNGQAITVSYAPGNLVDASANTLPTTSAYTVQNYVGLTQTNYADTNAGLNLGGRYTRSGNASFSFLESQVTGAACIFSAKNFGGTSYAVYVDGSLVTTYQWFNEGSLRPFVLFANASSAAHTITVRVAGWSFNQGGISSLLSVIGSAPALALTTSMTPNEINPVAGIGSQFGSSGIYAVNSWASGIQNDGVPWAARPNYVNYWQPRIGQSCRFRGTLSALRLISDDQNAPKTATFNLLVDGVLQRQIVISYPDTNTYASTTLTGLDSSEEHEYNLIYIGAQFGSVGSGPGLVDVLSIGYTGTINTAALTSRGYIVVLGDSMTEGYTANDNSETYGYKVGIALNKAVYNLGFSGSTVHLLTSGQSGYNSGTNGAGVAAESRVGVFTGSSFTTTQPPTMALSVAPTYVLFLDGYNDGALSFAGFQASYQTCLTTMLSGFPSTKILCLGSTPYNTSGTSMTQNATLTPLISAAVAAVKASYPSSVYFLDCNDVFAPLTDCTQESTLYYHPNASGHTKLRDKILTALPVAFPTTGVMPRRRIN